MDGATRILGSIGAICAALTWMLAPASPNEVDRFMLRVDLNQVPGPKFHCDEEVNNQCIIRDCLGGNVIWHMVAARAMEAKHERLVILGRTASACTMVADDMLKYNLVCAGPGAFFALHQARYMRQDGVYVPVTVEIYSYGPLKTIIDRHGGLPWDGFLILNRDELPIPQC